MMSKHTARATVSETQATNSRPALLLRHRFLVLPAYPEGVRAENGLRKAVGCWEPLQAGSGVAEETGVAPPTSGLWATQGLGVTVLVGLIQ